jgi:DNA-binding FadR family transcriptional regulator
VASSPPLASDSVHSRLRADIIEGRLAAGDPLPSERALSEQLGVNRHAVREALKRLQQAGLIRISQGGATRVLDWRQVGGLEVLLDLMDAPGSPPPELIRSVLEMRETIGVDAAVRFCERADDAERARAAGLAADAAAALAESGPESAEALTAFIALWQAIVDGSGNLAYRLGLNSLNAALGVYADLAGSLIPTPEELRALAAALEQADPKAVGDRARAMLAVPPELV